MQDFKQWIETQELDEGLGNLLRHGVWSQDKVDDKVLRSNYEKVKPQIDQQLQKWGMDNLFASMSPDQAAMSKRHAQDAMANLLVALQYGGVSVMRSDLEILWKLLNVKIPLQSGGATTLAKDNHMSRPLELIERLPRNPRIKWKMHPDAINYSRSTEVEIANRKANRQYKRQNQSQPGPAPQPSPQNTQNQNTGQGPGPGGKKPDEYMKEIKDALQAKGFKGKFNFSRKNAGLMSQLGKSPSVPNGFDIQEFQNLMAMYNEYRLAVKNTANSAGVKGQAETIISV